MSSQNAARVTVVVPVYNEKESLEELVDRVASTFEEKCPDYSYDMVFVDDGSTDGSEQALHKLAQDKAFVQAVILRTNRGKSMALTTGFQVADGDYIVTMDGDLQDNPEDIPKLIEKLEEGFDLVTGWRLRRETSLIRKIGSHMFNWVVCRKLGLELNDINCGFKILRKDLAKSLIVVGHNHRYIPVMAHLSGYKVAQTPIENAERKYGKSRYKAIRFQALFDFLSLLFLRRHGFNPLHFFGLVSAFLIVPSSLLLLYLMISHLLYFWGYGKELFSRPLLLLGAFSMLLGINIFLTGFVCDFVLHHSIRNSLDQSVQENIKARYENSASNSEQSANASESR